MKVNRRTALTRLTVGGLAVGFSGLVGSAIAESRQYTYDALGRLVLVVFQDGSSVQYAYDAAGNRTQVVRSATTPSDTFTQTIQITGTAPVNLRTLANAAGYAGDRHANVTFQLGSSVTITGAAGSPNGGVAIDSGDWPITLYVIALSLQVSGKAYGGGGKGGKGAVIANGEAGGAGGDAIYCRCPMSITVNTGAQVKGGGGGGGGGGGNFHPLDPPSDLVGGGGGGGFPNGPGGAKGNPAADSDDTGASAGAAGTTSGGGAGGSGETGGGGAGGAGGGAAAAGANGGVSGNKTRGVGGAAGYAVRKNGYSVAVTNNGTIAGTVG